MSRETLLEVYGLKTVVNRLYEAMFLIDSARAASDREGVNRNIRNILERAGAEIVSIRKWDERRLAYDIKGHSRGTYILCYFRADGRRIREIERDVQLSEQTMRVLILCAEQRDEADIERDTAAALAEKDVTAGARSVEEEAGAKLAEGDETPAGEPEEPDLEQPAGFAAAGDEAEPDKKTAGEEDEDAFRRSEAEDFCE